MHPKIKNIVFDLGGVVFQRDPKGLTPEFVKFYEFVTYDPVPSFWREYDRGELSDEQVAQEISKFWGCSYEYSYANLMRSIELQQMVEPTRELIRDLKAAGYGLYVLSNMAHSYIDHLRTFDVYSYFDADLVSCDCGISKPALEMYNLLLEKFSLQADECLFIDDRKKNTDCAEQCGMQGFVFDRKDIAATVARLREMFLE